MIKGELKIGNYVYQGIIRELRHTSAKVEYEVDGKQRTSMIFYENIDAIKLTEYYLCRFGFELTKSNVGVLKSFTNNGIRVDLSNSNNIYYKELPIQHLHHLQNLCFELTRKDLELKK